LYGFDNFVSYCTDENCSLVHGWAKFTTSINGANIPHVKPLPELAIFNVHNIVCSCIGIQDLQDPIPHSYIFLPSCKQWPELFQVQMIDLMEKEGEFSFEESDDDDFSRLNKMQCQVSCEF